MIFPTTVIGTILQLPVTFIDRDTNRPILMTGGSATVRVVGAAGVVVADEDCTIAGTLVYYDWDTAGFPAGRYQAQFEGTPPSGSLFIEPAAPIGITLVDRIG